MILDAVESSWLCCPACNDPAGAFAPIITNNNISALVCLSDICAGDTLLNIHEGVIQPPMSFRDQYPEPCCE